MKNMKYRILACLLVAAFSLSCTACGKKAEDSASSSDSSVSDSDSAEVATDSDGEEVIDSDDAEAINDAVGEDVVGEMKQDMSFDYAMDITTSSSNDGDGVVLVKTTSADENTSITTKTVETEVTVTDENGQAVTDENGTVKTETKTVVQDENGNEILTNENGSNQINYTADEKQFQAYWLDMSQGKDLTFGGDFIDITFKVKDDAPAGNYYLTEGNNDFANWDAEHVDVAYQQACITVGGEAQATGSAEDGVCSIVGSSVSANPGEEVTVRFDMYNNPGVVALIFRFIYDTNALEIVDAEVGSDCSSVISLATN